MPAPECKELPNSGLLPFFANTRPRERGPGAKPWRNCLTPQEQGARRVSCIPKDHSNLLAFLTVPDRPGKEGPPNAVLPQTILTAVPHAPSFSSPAALVVCSKAVPSLPPTKTGTLG